MKLQTNMNRLNEGDAHYINICPLRVQRLTVSEKIDIERNKMLGKAKKLAKAKHAGQVDKAGVDYFDGHLSNVASRVSGDAKIAAYLHDIIDDTDVTIDDLIVKHGFDSDIVLAVMLLSKKDGDTYFDRIRKIAKNKLARTVKLADIADHLADTGSIPVSLIKRYNKALAILGA